MALSDSEITEPKAPELTDPELTDPDFTDPDFKGPVFESTLSAAENQELADHVKTNKILLFYLRCNWLHACMLRIALSLVTIDFDPSAEPTLGKARCTIKPSEITKKL